MIETLVTGGSGFIGSAIVRKLRKANESVRVMSRNPVGIPPERRAAGTVYVPGNIFDSASLERALQGCDSLVIAAQFDNAPFENPRKGLTYEHVDGEGTEVQVAAAKKAGVQRLIYISGAGTREGRTEPWFRAKFRAERAVKESGMNWTIFQPSWVYGPGDRSLNKFAMFARLGPLMFFTVPLIGSGKGKIQPVFVEDLAESVQRSLNNAKTYGKTFEIGGPEELSMKQVVATLLKVMQKRRFIMPSPKPVMKLVANIVQHFPGRPLTPDGVDFVTMEEPVQTEPVVQALGVRLTPLSEGLGTYLGPTRNETGERALRRHAA